jgi:uncharacterized membrane protein
MWQLFLILSSIFGIIRDSLTKKITQKIDPLVALFYFYITAIGTAILIAFSIYNINPLALDRVHWLARLFGVSFGIGVYGLFSAIKINLTKTQIFTNYRNLVSITLAYFLLGEIHQVNIFSIFALIIFIASLILPIIVNQNSLQQDELSRQWVFWMTLNIIFVGSGLFFVKMFTKTLLPIDLLVNQYIGSFLVVSLILYIRQKSIIVTDMQTISLTLLNGIITAFSLFFLYVSIAKGQVSTITQVDNFIRTIFIIPIGLLVFKEHKSMSRVDYISLFLALFGAILLLFFV